LQETQGDHTRFVPKVRPTTKVAYVSIEELTKSRGSFNHNPPKLPPRLTRCSLSIPMKRRAIQTSQYSTAILESSQVTPSHLEDSIPKSNKHDEIVEGEGEVLLLESVAHSREREEEELKIWIPREALLFLSGQQPYGVGGGPFISPTSKEPLGRAFTG
jgi:hypothetical protein